MPDSHPPTDRQSRPTRSGFTPVTRAETSAELLIAGFCLAGFLFGLGAQALGSFNHIVQDYNQTLEGQRTSNLIVFLVMYAYPLFLVAALYYFWHVIERRRKTVRFNKEHVRGEATITHLWKMPPSGSGKRYYLGYRTTLGQNLSFEVDVATYKRIKVGETIPVDYLPSDPTVCCPVF